MVPRTLASPAAWRGRLFGRDPAVRRRFLAVALGVALLFGAGLVAPRYLPVEMSGAGYFGAMFVVTLAAATLNGRADGGLVASWVVAAAGLLPFALTFALTDAPVGREPTVANAASTLLGSAGLYGVAVGTAGYLLGVGARRVAAGRD